MSQQFFESDTFQREEVPNYCSFCGSRFLPNENRCVTCSRVRASSKRTSKTSVPWKKVLYEKQPYEDNYLDETFLSSLVSQETSAKLTYPQVVMQAMEVSLAISFVSLYLLVFLSMLENSGQESQSIQTFGNFTQNYSNTTSAIQAELLNLSLNNLTGSSSNSTISETNKWAEPTIIISVNLLVLLTGVVISVLLSPKIVKLKKIVLDLKAGGIVIGFVLVLSPMIGTFYENYADNTAYAISYALVLVHLIFRDYAYVSSEGDSTIRMDWSTLAIMYLSVILGSRFKQEIEGSQPKQFQQDSEKVFALWLTTLTLFVFGRTLQKTLREYSTKIYNYTSLTFIVGMGVVMYSISKISIIVYLLINFIIFFIGPLGLLWFYQYKNVIHGPWDLPNIKIFEE